MRELAVVSMGLGRTRRGAERYHACAEKDGVGLLRYDAVVGHGELVAGAEGSAGRECHLFVEKHGLARDEGERPGDVVLV